MRKINYEIKCRPKNQVSRSMLCAMVCLLLIGVSCSYLRKSAKSGKPSPPVEAKGPIIAMVMASSIDAKGIVVNPRFTFPQNEPQVMAIIYLGRITGSPLNVTWYKTTESGDEKLFEHQIQVKSHDRAFSVARNAAKTLSAGTYKVVASLDGQTAEIEWEVSQPKNLLGNGSPSAGDNIDRASVRGSYQMISMMQGDLTQQNGASTGTDSVNAQGQTPIAGSSGTTPLFLSPFGVCIGGGDEIGCGSETIDSTADVLNVYIWNPSGQSLTVDSGLNASIGPVRVGVTNQESTDFLVDPCFISDIATDLPGSKISFGVSNAAGSGIAYSTFTLGDDTFGPLLKVNSTPARGTKVKAGDKIKIKVTANETHRGESWQTGVKVIQITSEPGGLVKNPWVNPSGYPKPCTEKTWEQDDEASYTVPNNPPPIIRICALAEDYVGNQAQPLCGEFPTGNVWKGTMHSVVQGTAGNYSCSSVFDAILKLSVTGDELAGNGQATYTSTTCKEGPVPRCSSIGFKFQGRAFGDRLEIHVTSVQLVPSQCTNWGFAAGYFPAPHPNQPLMVPITAPGTADGQSSSVWSLGTNQYTTSDTIHLKCETCAP